MESPVQSTQRAAPADLDGLAALVRAALAQRYDAPLVEPQEDGTIAVLEGAPLQLARDAAARAGVEDVEARVVALDVAALPRHAVPAAGLRLWRQHARSGDDGELVTETEAGDPPLQVLTSVEGWPLVRLADGATGWVDPACAGAQELAHDEGGELLPDGVLDAGRVDVEAFVAAALALEGAPYVWGGTTDAGVDCSGIVQRAAWRSSRCWLPRHSRALLRVGARVAPSSPGRGDVLVLQRAAGAGADGGAAPDDATRRSVPAHGPAVHPMHVAIALSADEVLHASRDEMRVVREPLASLRARYRVLGVRRLGPAGDGPE